MKSFENYYYDLAGTSDDWLIPSNKRMLVEINKKAAGGRVLEVGCGTGKIVPHLKDHVEYIGFDVSDFAIAKAKELNSSFPNAKFLKMAGEKLPFADNYFDVVLGFNVLEHFSRPKAALLEMVRVLQSDGILVLTGPNLDLPLSLPNAIRHRGKLYKFYFRCLRCTDYIGRIFGFYSFRTINPNFTEFTGKYEKPDDDLRYVLSVDEVTGFLKNNGLKIKYIEIDSIKSGVKQRIKKIIKILPGMQYYGQGLNIIFSNEKNS